MAIDVKDKKIVGSFITDVQRVARDLRGYQEMVKDHKTLGPGLRAAFEDLEFGATDLADTLQRL